MVATKWRRGCRSSNSSKWLIAGSTPTEVVSKSISKTHEMRVFARMQDQLPDMQGWHEFRATSLLPCCVCVCRS
ncbi:protein of unknown function [Hyphomicrobium sp. MC1]|nr:protein of unknown function [Hyphomicrobium sp. MC1]